MLLTPGEPAAGRLLRRSGGRIVGGVAGGLADHLGVDVTKVRIVFVLLTALAGAGVVAYGLLWMFTPSGPAGPPPSPAERRQAYGVVIIGLALSAGLSWLVSGTAAQILGPLLVVALGAALVWREVDTSGSRGLRSQPQRLSVLTWSRILGGGTLVVVGLGVVILARIDLSDLGAALLAVAVTLLGAALLTVPPWLRMVRALNAERAARIRNAEREEIASHLHDSVLQTLALIQRQSDCPQEVQRLARSQERELRRWLFDGGDNAHTGFTAALRAIAGEVEDTYGVKVTAVTVGDEAVADAEARQQLTALLGATRECLVNAAKHSGVRDIDLYVEVDNAAVDVFVRDRGCGFDPDAVGEDRHGLARSVRGRIERRGGQVRIRTTPGKGTEIRMTVPLSRSVSAGGEER